jgi:hypothetical protein
MQVIYKNNRNKMTKIKIIFNFKDRIK